MFDFSLNTRNSLARKGIFIIGTCIIPNVSSDMPFANGDRGYKLNDNGCHRIKTYLEVKELAQ